MFRDQFLDGMSRAACTVSVITTDGPAGRAGVTVSAMTSVSADSPSPSLLVCVHHKSAAAAAIRENRVFCANVLRDDQSYVSDTFAGRIKTASGDKFECAEWRILESGAPVLSDALVAFDCHLRNHFQWGSHFIFIGELADIAVNDAMPPLIYANRAYGTPVSLERLGAGGRGPGPDGAEGSLDIGCFVTLGPYFLPGLLAAFAGTHPNVEVNLLEGDQERLTDGLRRGDIALALTYDIGLPDDLDIELLGEIHPHVLLPAEHPLAAQARISLADLAAEPMVLLDIPPSDSYFTSLFEGSGLTPRIAYRSPSFEMVRGMVGHGLGYALLATKPANSMTYDGRALVTRGLAEDPPGSRFVVARRPGGDASTLADAFLDHCRERFSPA